MEPFSHFILISIFENINNLRENVFKKNMKHYPWTKEEDQEPIIKFINYRIKNVISSCFIEKNSTIRIWRKNQRKLNGRSCKRIQFECKCISDKNSSYL